MTNFFIKKLFPLFLCLISTSLLADTVKPALVEITVTKKGQVDIEIRASIEAILSDINARFKNTKDSPNADKYDNYRKMPESELAQAFDLFKSKFINRVKLSDTNGDKVPLSIYKVKIPEPGYTKVPRISTINLSGTIDLSTQSLKWYYPAAFGDNAVRLRQVDKEKQKYHWSQWQWLKSDETSRLFSLTEIIADKPLIQTITNYIVLGFEHILPKGLDHILFILGLFLFSVSLRPLLAQVTMFTIAHTITLGLAMNGLIQLPSNIVEPLIALSIAYIGVENIFSRKLRKSRLVLVFMFGLLHGLGFASVLSDLGMPDNAFVTALISFNVGVELGQLTIITLAFLLVGFWFGKKDWYDMFVIKPASIVISLIAGYWFIERLSFL